VYLLDTNVCIYFLLGQSNVLESRIDAAFGNLTVSTITVAELRVGNKTSTDPKRDEQRLNAFLAGLDIAMFDETAAIAYGLAVRDIGVKRKSFDRLIGAHALALGLTLVTNNPKHFADVPGLKVENWTV
jgi:tRNA(fMet)-specific endonuclease VapC